MLADTLIQQTAARFPRLARGSIELQPLEKGGSDRSYYRVREPDGHTLILVKYGDGREENRHYCAIARFLASLGIHVPEIFVHDEDQRLIWMEDLGDRDLWLYRHEPWPVRRALYASALQEIATLHSRAHRALPRAGSSLHLQVEFNTDLYRWEQSYFFENCLGRYFGLSPEKMESCCPREALEKIATTLAALPRVLVHRDFQSQNILITDDGAAHLIDFQGLRPGLAQYDLASLIYDPYVALSPDEREELIALYLEKARAAGNPPRADFRTTLDLCAMQRLMQALGAYGFLGLVKKRAHFLSHIPAALASLGEISRRIPSLNRLCPLLDDLTTSATAGAGAAATTA